VAERSRRRRGESVGEGEEEILRNVKFMKPLVMRNKSRGCGWIGKMKGRKGEVKGRKGVDATPLFLDWFFSLARCCTGTHSHRIRSKAIPSKQTKTTSSKPLSRRRVELSKASGIPRSPSLLCEDVEQATTSSRRLERDRCVGSSAGERKREREESAQSEG